MIARVQFEKKKPLVMAFKQLLAEFEYLHHSPMSRRRQRKRNPVPEGVTGPPCSWGI
jgi:hypothetical protein